MSLQKNILFCDGEVFSLDRGLLMGASTCNSIIIEIYGDRIRVSRGFSRIDMLFFIADSNASALSAENDHITNFAGPLIYTSLLEKSQFFKTEFNCDLIKNSCSPVARAATDKFDISPKFKNRFV